jgi:predicted RNase H-like nuclease
VFEVHPEVSFWALNRQQPVISRKRRLDGERERLALLSGEFSDDLSAMRTPGGADRDDFYDACAAAWTASRYARGEHGTLPDNPPVDSRGLRMEIVY